MLAIGSCKDLLMQPLNFWHRSFLTKIMVDHYPLFEFACSKINERKKIYNVCIKLLVPVVCYVVLVSPPRHQHPQCFHCVLGLYMYITSVLHGLCHVILYFRKPDVTLTTYVCRLLL